MLLHPQRLFAMWSVRVRIWETGCESVELHNFENFEVYTRVRDHLLVTGLKLASEFLDDLVH